MRNILRAVIPVFILLGFMTIQAQPGCPAVITTPNVTVPCGQSCTNLTASALGGGSTTSYSVGQITYAPPVAFNTGTNVLVDSDDKWSQVIPLGFNFCFFGNTYSSVIVGSNGCFGFNTANANTGNNWAIPGTIPFVPGYNGEQDMYNTIMTPWQDMDNTHVGNIYYYVGGTAPCRYFVASWYQCPMYGDPNSVNTDYCTTAQSQTQMGVIYETSNVIDVYIAYKAAPCDSKHHRGGLFPSGFWNDGLAIEGIQNANGRIGYAVPGRNATRWPAANGPDLTNDAWRFTPNGLPLVYTITWFQGTTQVGTGSPLNVCPTVPVTKYSVIAKYTNCDGTTVSDTAAVVLNYSKLSVTDSAVQPICNGSTNGSVLAHFHSLAGVSSFGWSPNGAGDSTLTNLGAGTYVFNVADSAGCVASDTEILKNPAPLAVTVLTDTVKSCAATTTSGVLTATTANGTSPYNYLWTGGSTANPLSGLNYGSYSVTATDQNGCTGTTRGTVFSGVARLLVTDSVKQPSCNGSTNGAVFASFNATSGIISYGWAPGGAGDSVLTGLGAGTYIFTISDSAGCVISDTAVLTNPAPIVVTVANDTANSCTGATNNGVLTATTTGGTPGYNYTWSSGPTTNPITGLNVGSYTVTVTDQNGCTGSAGASVSVQTGALAFASPQITEVRCYGSSTGEIIDPVNGGTNPITYTWSSGTAHGDTLANLAAGGYSVTAVDANGCSATAAFTITQPASVVAVTVANDTVTSCNGSVSSGVLTANAAGGTSGYTYLWSNTLTTSTITGLTAGNYSVTVADTLGCTVSASASVVINSSSLSITGRIVNPVCIGIKGEIIVTVTGGVQPINYHWSAGSTTIDTLRGIGSGTYSVTATDANGCSISASYTVVSPQPIIVTVPNDTISTCSGVTTAGVLTASTTGGAPGYTYLWSNASTTNPITGLGAGTYLVTATDINGCSASGSGTVIVTTNPITFYTPQITNALCAGSSTGQIILGTTGGTAPITFTWSGGTTQNDTLRNLAGGTYVIVATDVNGCSDTVSYTVGQPSAIVFGTPVITNVGCSGGNGGSIAVTATGGTGTITYKWSNGLTTSTITGLTAGGYIVTATDGNGCTASASYNVSQSAPIAIGPANVVGISCLDSTGSIFDTASGGTGTLTYKWTGGSTGQNITNIKPGGYGVTVTDANGCSASAYYILGKDTCATCPQVTVNGGTNNISIPCSQTCTNLIAKVFGGLQTTTYTVGQISYNPPAAFNAGTKINFLTGTDDYWSRVITLPFNFCFFGIPYNKIVAGTNGEISFNTGNATGTESWAISTNPLFGGQGPVPFANPALETDQRNTIMGPWQDIDFTNRGSAYYNVTGTAPCRKFEVSWYDSPMFGDSLSNDNTYCDSTDHQTQMIVLYETTNLIDIYIKTKDILCNDLDTSQVLWNKGLAIEGIVNNNMTVAYTVPGRNATQWSAYNDAWRFTPAGTPGTAPAYSLAWYQNGNLLGTTDTITVCPKVPTTYTVVTTYANCDNSQVIVADSVYVTPGGALAVSIDSTHQILCNNDSSGAVYASYTDTSSTVTSFGWSPGGANQTSLVNIPAGTYIFTVNTASGCSKSDTVILANPAKVVATVANDTFTSCTINNLGTLTVTGSGGTPGYTYLWSNGSSTATITGQTPGTYTVTVTDSHGCTGSATATIVKVASNLAFTTPVVKNPVCTANGSINAGVTGGTDPLNYSWSPSEPNSGTITGLSGGTYALTVTDAGGCSITASYTLNAPNPVVIDSTNLVDAGCHTSDNGSITVYTTGGTGSLNYSWAGGGGTFPDSNTISNLVAGNYSITITDSLGCSVSATYTLTSPSAIAAQSVVIVNVTCQAQGSVTVIDTGGTAPLSYAWSGGQTVDSITNQPAGTYNLTVTDAAGCTATAAYTIGTAPGGVVIGTPVIVNTSCNGDSTGSITVTATGGHGTITYIWSTSATTNSITGLGAGVYSVTASDTSGCSASASFTVTQPTKITFGVPVITNVTCYGGSNGSIASSASGGTGTITYLWSNGGTTATVTGLVLGNYCVTATDSVGCSASVCYNVTQPTPVIVDSSTLVPVTCTAAGQITLYVSGGTPGYTYLWSNSQTSNPVSVVQAGGITVTITDANGCTVTDSVTETAGQGAVKIDSADITGVTCNGGSNGIITVYASTDSTGGPITFKWSTTATTSTITGLSAGVTYTITATDSAGCSATASYVVPQPNAITFNTPVIVQPTCNGGSNGSVTANAIGGTGTITYVWGDGTTGPKDSSLAQGSYSVTATDSVGCSASITYNVTQPAAVTFGPAVIDSIKCNGGTGGITVNATGGTGTITYAWAASTGATITGLTFGNYCVTATDSVGCSASMCYTLTQPALLVIDSGVVTGATCSKTGSVVITVSGGTTGYSYSWSGGSSSKDSLGGLTGGPVTVTVTDFNGCTATATYNVPPAVNTVLIDSAVVVNEKCNGASTGSIVVTASGGFGTLTYHWGTNPSVTDSIKNVAAGTYAITVTDSVGCTATASYQVSQPTAIVIADVDSSQVTCTSQGSLWVIASGGTGSYTYTWQGSAVTTDTLANLAAGTYNVTVTDSNGCSVSAVGTVTTAPNSITLDSSVVQPTCFGLSNGSLTVIAHGGSGGYTYLWANSSTTATITGLAAGTYCVTVHDSNGCSKTACDSVGQPSLLVISRFITDTATCNALGSAQVIASGGTPVYHYLWSPGGSTANPITGLSGGAIVDVTVTDANLCTVTGADTLPAAFLPLTISNPDVVPDLCYGYTKGSISFTVTGGDPNATPTYIWSPGGQTTASISNLAAGTYYVTVLEAAQGCQTNDSFKIVQPAPYVVAVSAKPLVCPGTCDTASVTVTPANAFQYAWSNGATTQSASYCNLATTPSSIVVTVTDNNGCTASGDSLIAAAQQIEINPKVDTTACSSLGAGNFAANGSGGAPGGLTYTYNPGNVSNTTGVFNYLAAGTYTYTVTDALGCSVDSSFIIPVQPPLDSAITTADSATCFGTKTGKIVVSITTDSIQDAPFTYALNGGAAGSSNVFDTVAAGNYLVVVTNQYGCKDSIYGEVGQPKQQTVNFSPDTVYGFANTAIPLTPIITNFVNPVYSWTPTTGLACPTCGIDSATLTAPQLYYVTVNDSGNAGCSVTDSVWVLLYGPIMMPNAFSPNGDGKNDLFGPLTLEHVVVKEFHIYNRWGQLVHNSTSYWDGKFDGKEQPDGTYIYYIEGTYIDPNTNLETTGKVQGAVTLLR